MEDLEIFLSCGFTTRYENFNELNGTIQCMICNSHEIDVKECLNMPRNRLNIKQKELELEKEKFENVKKSLETHKTDPSFYINESFKRVQNEIDLRREELIKQIQDYFENIQSLISAEKTLKHEIFDQNLKRIESFLEQKNDKLKEGLNFNDKMNFLEKTLSDYRERIEVINSALSELKNEKFDFEFNQKNNMEEIFGKIVSKGQSELPVNPEAENLNETNSEYISKDKNVVYTLERTFQGHQGSVWDLKVINDNKILSVSFDSMIKLWDMNTGSCIKSFDGHKNCVNCVYVLSNELFASGSDDKTIKIWNIDTGKCVRTMDEHTDSVWCLKLIKKDILISGSEDCTIKKWNYSNAKCLKTFTGHESVVRCLETFDTKIISGSYDETIRVWSMDGVCERVMRGHGNWVLGLKVINKEFLFSCSKDKTIRIWNIEQGECVNTLNGHREAVSSLNQLGTDRLVSGSWDGRIKIWNIEALTCIKTIPAEHWINCIEISQENIFSGSDDTTFKKWILK